MHQLESLVWWQGQVLEKKTRRAGSQKIEEDINCQLLSKVCIFRLFIQCCLPSSDVVSHNSLTTGC